MILRGKILFIILAVLPLFVLGHEKPAPVWFREITQIEPLKSSQSDVERAFAGLKTIRSFKQDGKKYVLYESLRGKFSVEYSLGECPIDEDLSYLTQADKVLRIILFPRLQVPC